MSEKYIVGYLDKRAYGIWEDRARRVRQLLRKPEFVEEVIANPKRIVDMLSDMPERKANWRLAEIEFAADVIEGNINFVQRIGPESYWRLQNQWLEDVKRFKAYLFWEQSGDVWSWDLGKADYYEACRWFQERLGDVSLKESTSEFENAQRFMENYLLSGGIVDPRKKDDARALIERKAHKLWEDNPERGSDENWKDAERYVKLFYENIIASVVNHDGQRASAVLSAAEPIVQPRWYKIVDCLEAALLVYYIEKSAVDAFLGQLRKA